MAQPVATFSDGKRSIQYSIAVVFVPYLQYFNVLGGGRTRSRTALVIVCWRLPLSYPYVVMYRFGAKLKKCMSVRQNRV